jgi:hypothetical protein
VTIHALSLKGSDTDRNRSFALDVVKKSRWYTRHLEKKYSKSLKKLVEDALKTIKKQVESVQNTAHKVSTFAKVAQTLGRWKDKVSSASRAPCSLALFDCG